RLLSRAAGVRRMAAENRGAARAARSAPHHRRSRQRPDLPGQRSYPRVRAHPGARDESGGEGARRTRRLLRRGPDPGGRVRAFASAARRELSPALSGMNTVELIRRKRDGQALSPEGLRRFVADYTANVIPDYQAAALLMAIY